MSTAIVLLKKSRPEAFREEKTVNLTQGKVLNNKRSLVVSIKLSLSWNKLAIAVHASFVLWSHS